MFKFLIKGKSSDYSIHLAKYSAFSWFFVNNVLQPSEAKALHQIEITWQRYPETTSALYFRVRGSIDSPREFARFGRFRALIICSLFKKKITMSKPLQPSTTAIKCTVSDCWRALQKLRSDGPLVQCITNYVSMDIMANTLLAIGASPAMAHGEFNIFMFSYSCERQ